jgi:hypothetical protein
MADTAFIATLMGENPDFLPDSGDVEDGLTYLIANDFARYLADLEDSYEFDRRNTALASLETLAKDASTERKDLLIEALETLNDDPRTNTDSFNSQLGPELLKLRHFMLANRR